MVQAVVQTTSKLGSNPGEDSCKIFGFKLREKLVKVNNLPYMFKQEHVVQWYRLWCELPAS